MNESRPLKGPRLSKTQIRNKAKVDADRIMFRVSSNYFIVGEFDTLEQAKAEADRLNGNSRHSPSSPSSSSIAARRR
jgi:hypothetical protein